MASPTPANRFFVTTLVLVAQFSAQLHSQPQADWARVRETNAPAMLFLRTTAVLASGFKNPATGSGFLVTKNGYALTAAHVVPKSIPGATQLTYTAAIGGPNEVQRPLTVVYSDELNDLALIKIDPGPHPWPVVEVNADADLELDAPIYTLGFPGGGNLDGVLGTVRSALGSLYVTDAAIDHGNSGGPVFGRDGRVVAIAVGAVPNSSQRNLLVPISFARLWLTQVGVIHAGSAPPVAAPPPALAGPAVKLPNQYVGLSNLPVEMRSVGPPDTTPEALHKDLRQRGSLVLDGTSLVVGPHAGAYNLRVDDLVLNQGARIITNGNTLRIVARRIVVNSGEVVAFTALMRTAASGGAGRAGFPGRSGGRLILHAASEIVGVLPIDLSGQDGGRGGQGTVGAQGHQGQDGRDAAMQHNTLNCLHRGGDGDPGTPGGRGGAGGSGGAGGDGGFLRLERWAHSAVEGISFKSRGGQPGEGGQGGPGGRGGPGGKGGRRVGLCGGGKSAPPGSDGPEGEKGQNGAPGEAGNAHRALSLGSRFQPKRYSFPP